MVVVVGTAVDAFDAFEEVEVEAEAELGKVEAVFRGGELRTNAPGFVVVDVRCERSSLPPLSQFMSVRNSRVR